MESWWEVTDTLIPRGVAGLVTTPTVHDQVVSRRVADAVMQDHQLTIIRRDDMLETVTFTSSNTAVATVNPSGLVTHVSDGTAAITITSDLRTVTKTFTFTTGGGATVDTITGPVAGSLRAALTLGVDSRNPADRSRMPIWSIYVGNATRLYVHNDAGWLAGIDLTSIAVNNSWLGSSLGFVRVAGPFVLGCNHCALPTGRKIGWSKADGTYVERTVIAQARVGSSDIQVYRMDSDLPDGIGTMATLPSTHTAKLPAYAIGIPVVHVNQFREASIVENWLPSDWVGLRPSLPARAVMYSDVVQWDSGTQIIGIIGTMPVLLSTLTSGGTGGGDGPSIPDNVASINAAIASLGGSQTLTTMDVSGYNTF
jgi:hypothetical protein